MKKFDAIFTKPPIDQLNSLLRYYQAGRYVDAEKLSLLMTQKFPEHQFAWKVLGAVLKQTGKISESLVVSQKSVQLEPLDAEANNNLGATLKILGRYNEAEESYKKAIALKPNYVEAHNNLGAVLQKLGRYNEAVESYKKAIALKPNYVEAHNNLGNTLYSLNRYNEAEESYKKAIVLKPDYLEAHNNLGAALQTLGRYNEAEESYKKAIALKPNHVEAHNNLEITLNEKKLWKILQKAKVENELSKPNFTKDLFSKLFVSNRSVETELFAHLYKIKSIEISKTKNGPLYGAGSTTNYQLFKNDYSILKTVEQDLTNIIKKAVKSEIYIFESFYNILKVGGGSVPHTHISNFDKRHGLINQKFSLVYYISVGDQNTKDPGLLKLYDPDEEILPSEGLIAIFPGNRKHSSIYSGTSDRVMIGVNFYSLL